MKRSKFPIGSWESHVEQGIEQLIYDFGLAKSIDHVEETPERYVKALKEYLSGYGENPSLILQKGFSENKYDQMIFILDIPFISHCMHHIAPFFGKIHFAYLPDNRIVGLSKIPRIVEVLSRRLQIQEKLSCEIVDVFQEVIKPLGCGVVIEAQHFCVCARGIRSVGTVAKTQALRGSFIIDQKQEFLAGAKSRGGTLL